MTCVELYSRYIVCFPIANKTNRRETGAVRVPAISITKEHTQRCGDQPTKQIPQRNFIVLFDKASEGGAAFAMESWHGGGTKQMGANARSHFMHPIPDLLGASATARLHSPQLHEETTARRSLKLQNFVWKRLLADIGHFYTWNRMGQDIQQFCAGCILCAEQKASHQAQQPLGCPSTVKYEPGSDWIYDIVEGLKPVSGCSAFVTCVELYSRYIVCFPIANKTSKAIGEKLEQFVFQQFQSPRNIHSDVGINLQSKGIL